MPLPDSGAAFLLGGISIPFIFILLQFNGKGHFGHFGSSNVFLLGYTSAFLRVFVLLQAMKKNPPKNKNMIFGAHAVMEAMEAGQSLDKILLRKGTDSGLRKDVFEQAEKSGVPVQVVPVEKLDRLTRGGNHQGIAAYLSMVSYADLEEVLIQATDNGEVPLVVALDQVSDVRNFGAIARTAECMGVHALVIPEQGSARINGDAVKVSAGALHHLPVARVRHIQDAVMLAQSYGLNIVACTEKGEGTFFDLDLNQPTFLVFGSEETGISPRIIKSANDHARIPMSGKISSLNVGVSVGMALMEVARQRQSGS